MGAAAHERLTESGDWSERLVLREHRYMLEDVRIGLSLLCSVAALAGVRRAVGAGVPGDWRGGGGGGFHANRPHAWQPRAGRAGPGGAAGDAAGWAGVSVVALGAGRMGRGIAVVFAFAGYEVALVDAKPRAAEAFAGLAAAAMEEIGATFATMARIGLMQEADRAPLLARIRVTPHGEAAAPLARPPR